MNCPGCGWDGFDPSIHQACDGTDGPVAPWADDDAWDDEPWDDPVDDEQEAYEAWQAEQALTPCYAGEDCLVHNGGFGL